MSVAGIFKRIIVGLILLVVAGVALLSATYTYIDNSPEAQERLKVSVEDVEDRVDEDASVMTKLSALAASWWNSDDLVAEAQDDKARTLKAEAAQRKKEEEHRFNDSRTGYDDDYYPGD